MMHMRKNRNRSDPIKTQKQEEMKDDHCRLIMKQREKLGIDYEAACRKSGCTRCWRWKTVLMMHR